MKVSISSYRSIRRLDLELGACNLLIGGNGAGKTNFLSVFQLLQAIQQQEVPAFLRRVGQEGLFFWGKENFHPISIVVEFSAESIIDLTIYQGQSNLNFMVGIGAPESLYGEFLEFDPARDFYQIKSKSPRWDELAAAYAKLNLAIYPPLPQVEVHAPVVAEGGLREPSVPYGLPQGNLAAALLRLRQEAPSIYHLIQANIRSIAPVIADFVWPNDPLAPPVLRWRGVNSERIFPEQALSAATRHFMALAVLLLQPELPQVIVLDGPETGLHPWAIGKLAGMIGSAAARGSQLLVATQSTDLLGHFQPAEVITVDQKDGASEFNRLDAEQLATWLEDHTLDDLWKRQIIATGQP